MNSKRTGPNALPIYLQISELLIRDIASGRLVDGERLPPERDLAKQHDTTVRTLRKSLAELEKNGLLERRQGSGNYIRQAAKVDSVYSMFRLELRDGGGLPTADILGVYECDKGDQTPAFGTSNRGTRIRRLRYLNGIVIAVEEIWLDRDAGEVKAELVSDSLYRYYKQNLGFWITRAEDRVSIGQVPEWAPDSFGPRAGSITGYIERFSWAQGPEPVEFSRTWFDTDKALYVQRMI